MAEKSSVKYALVVNWCAHCSSNLHPMDDFPLRLEHVLVLNSQIKCACRVAEAQAHQIQAPSIV